jgi:hypothetical protein
MAFIDQRGHTCERCKRVKGSSTLRKMKAGTLIVTYNEKVSLAHILRSTEKSTKSYSIMQSSMSCIYKKKSA